MSDELIWTWNYSSSTPAPSPPTPPPQYIQLLTVNDWSQFKKTLELKLGKWRGINDSAVEFDWGESSEKE